MSFANQSDVTGTVDLTRPEAVRDAVCQIFAKRYPDMNIALIHQAFRDIEDAFWGRYAGFLACDTPYHDLRHSLSTALLMARMVDGYEASRGSDMPALGSEAGTLAVLLALYHDIGFIRRTDEAGINGASLILTHEQRGVDFMRTYLAQGPLAAYAERADLIHATNFARPLDQLLTDLPGNMVLVCQMLGTADLVSQVAGRYYLERCRHFLFDEFVIAGADRITTPDGKVVVLYRTPEDLLRKTPGFYENAVKQRIENFGAPYRCVAAHFGGDNPYQRGIDRNINYLKSLIESNDFSGLTRKPVPLMPLPEDQKVDPGRTG